LAFWKFIESMKHNNIIPNAHFRKDWQRYVKVWLDQPARKQARRSAREARAARIAPRPTESLRPVVRGQTNKYNMRVRSGRGFTFDELKGAGVRRKEAQGLGIAIDHRRKNRNEEAYMVNVARLKSYRSKLIIFPRKPANKRAKKGDSSKEAVKHATQNSLPLHEIKIVRDKARKITEKESALEVANLLHKERVDAKLWCRRAKRAHDKKEGKTKKDKQKEADKAAGVPDDAPMGDE